MSILQSLNYTYKNKIINGINTPPPILDKLHIFSDNLLKTLETDDIFVIIYIPSLSYDNNNGIYLSIESIHFKYKIKDPYKTTVDTFRDKLSKVTHKLNKDIITSWIKKINVNNSAEFVFLNFENSNAPPLMAYKLQAPIIDGSRVGRFVLKRTSPVLQQKTAKCKKTKTPIINTPRGVVREPISEENVLTAAELLKSTPAEIKRYLDKNYKIHSPIKRGSIKTRIPKNKTNLKKYRMYTPIPKFGGPNRPTQELWPLLHYQAQARLNNSSQPLQYIQPTKLELYKTRKVRKRRGDPLKSGRAFSNRQITRV